MSDSITVGELRKARNNPEEIEKLYQKYGKEQVEKLRSSISKTVKSIFSSNSTKKYEIPSELFLNTVGKYAIIDQGKKAIAGFTNNEDVIYHNVPVIVFGDHTTNLKFIKEPFAIGGQGVKLLKLNEPDRNNLLYFYYLLSFNMVKTEGYKRHFSILAAKKLSILHDFSEQEKIANFLSALDDHIDLQENRISLLEQQKKGYALRIFNRKLRFQDDNGDKYPEWEEKTLENIGIFSKGQGLPKADLTNQGVRKAMHYGELFGAKATIYPKNKTNILGKAVSKKYDVLIPASDVTPTGLATASTVLEEGIVLGGDINILSPYEEYCSVYIAYVIRSLKDRIIKNVVGTTVKHIYPNILKKISYPFPSFPEQEKIANFLSLLDNQIELEKEKLAQYKLQKQGYMQRIFG